jgi:hypothetical protein
VKIKGWEDFQHFKDRTPPWIKLYRYLLDDPEWHELSGDDSKVLVMLWLIASEDKAMEGNLPNIKTLCFRLRISESKLNQSLTKLNHWVIRDDIKPISQSNQVVIPETERETKTKTETETKRERETKRGTRFELELLTSEWANEALKIRPDFDNNKCLAIFDEFKDYWISKAGKDGIKTDWLATWRNWIRREKGFSKEKPMKGHGVITDEQFKQWLEPERQAING